MASNSKVKFGKWEAVLLIINTIGTKIFLFYPRMTVETAGTAGWILSIYNSLLAFIIFTVLIMLYKNFEDKDILDIAEEAGGRLLKTFTGIVIVSFLIVLGAEVLRQFSEDMKVVSLSISPLSFIMILFLIGVIAGCFFGMEAIIRYHSIVVPIIAVGYIIILATATPKIDITNITPILGTGLNDIFVKGFSRVSVYAELIILFLIMPYVGGYKNARSIGYTAIGITSVLFTIGSLIYILVFPYPASLERFLPIYQMSRLIDLGRFLRRIEPIFVFIWAIAALANITTLVYFTLHTFTKSFEIKYMRPLILPFAVILFCITFIPPDIHAVIDIIRAFFSKIAWIVTFVFIGAIMLIAFARKKLMGREKANE